MNLFLFLAVGLFLTFLTGRFLEKIKVPGVFSALILGLLLAVSGRLTTEISQPLFASLSDWGMYFLLFIIGLEINLGKLKKLGAFIVKSTLMIILFEACLGSLLIHFFFHYSWFISLTAALSFATVGEAILIPILDEFKVINSDLGQTIIGIGTLDDIFEIAALIMVTVLINVKADSWLNFISLQSQLAPIGVLLAGIILRQFFPADLLQRIITAVKIIAYRCFVPIFFLRVGARMDVHYLFSYPLLVLLVVAVSNAAKIFASWLMGRKKLGLKKSILLGIGLSVRFSTSLIVIKILFENGLIGVDLYSVVVASSIVFAFIVPVLFSKLLVRWKSAFEVFSD